ncbi:MAG: hypothetical protein ABF778_03730 [Liquorilactobacillus hordei]|uniref:hypothetical protein n=1 Tax=Liquorilactobacillus hordei TaxID=468911 RepID=UPI0039EC592C
MTFNTNGNGNLEDIIKKKAAQIVKTQRANADSSNMGMFEQQIRQMDTNKKLMKIIESRKNEKH